MATAIHAAQVTYRAPDLAVMESFLTDFGLHKVEGSDENTLYMRGTGAQHQIHVTHKAEKQGFVGASIEVATREDLDELAALPGSGPVQEAAEPGGGYEVVMHTPDGVEIRAIWGRLPAPPLPTRPSNQLNTIDSKPRSNASVRQRVEPCDVVRLGHFVLHVSDHDETVAWFMERFNFLASDYFATPGDETVYGTFIRLDAGEELVDHHFMLILQSSWTGVHHCSFEVVDLDSVMSAHDYLLEQGYTLDVGVGRHMLGSQIFDYWKDPFGFRVEHYTDGDQVNNRHQPSKFTGTAEETTQYGIPYSLSPGGQPVIHGAVAYIDCTVDKVVEAGDHDIVLGAVDSLKMLSTAYPLLFFRGGYGAFQPSTMTSRDVAIRKQLKCVTPCRGVMEELAEQMDSEVTVLLRDGKEVVLAAAAGRSQSASVPTRVGIRLPFAPPMGSLDAALGGAEAEEVWLAGAGENGMTRDSSTAMLERVRERGYSIAFGHDAHDLVEQVSAELGRRNSGASAEDLHEALRVFAEDYNRDLRPGEQAELRYVNAPVYLPNGELAFGLTLWGPPGEVADTEIQRYIDAVLASAARCTQILADEDLVLE